MHGKNDESMINKAKVSGVRESGCLMSGCVASWRQPKRRLLVMADPRWCHERLEWSIAPGDSHRRGRAEGEAGLVVPLTRGDSDSPLRWACKSVRRLADELKGMNEEVNTYDFLSMAIGKGIPVFV